jgi:hypothetical protein
MPANREPLVALTLTEAAELLEQIRHELVDPCPLVEHLARLIERGVEHSPNRMNS